MARPLFARIASLTLAACLTAAAWAGDAEPSFIPVKEAALGVWAAQPFTELKKAKMVADLDATRMLAERLYGSVLSSTEISRDKLAVSQIIETGLAFQSRLTGLATASERAYADGRYSVELAVGWEQAVQIVREEIEKRGKTVTLRINSVTTTKEVRVLRSVGWGGLPGSDGWRKVVALRAAQIDAQRALTQRLGPALIEAYGKAEFGKLVSEGIAKSLAGCLAGGLYGDPTFARHGDGWVATTPLSIAKGSVVETIKSFTDSTTTKLEQTVGIKDIETFTEDGSGSDDGWKDLLKGTSTPSSAANSPAGTSVVERILGEIIIIR
ncbi:hypothetical protein LBMAG53_38100 [Planctomycetota bacterium]|nr:hypothetical protein LBMAG53_38100 [Planctomycetota bacterium]